MKIQLLIFLTIAAASTLCAKNNAPKLLSVIITEVQIGNRSVKISCSIINKSSEPVRFSDFDFSSTFNHLVIKIDEKIATMQFLESGVLVKLAPPKVSFTEILAPEQKISITVRCHSLRIINVPVDMLKKCPLESNGDYVLNWRCYVADMEYRLQDCYIFGTGNAKIKGNLSSSQRRQRR